MGRPRKDGTPSARPGPRGPREPLGPQQAALKLSGLLSNFDFYTQDRIWETAKALRALKAPDINAPTLNTQPSPPLTTTWDQQENVKPSPLKSFIE
jgi:hypothetical protein